MTEVSDEMVEAACAGYWPTHWPQHMSEKDAESIRTNMRAALNAALAARPSPTGEKVEADKEALIDFLINYGGRCRDCADENGFCPRTGIGCGQRRQAAVFFVSALEYGSKHGFAGGYTLVSAATIAALVAERDEALRYAEQLAVSLAAKHYPDVPQWKPLSGDLWGLLSQIDNMTTGLCRAEPPHEAP